MTETAQAMYREREQRVLDALALRKPDRVPVILVFGSFAARYAGIAREDPRYDLEKSYEANLRATLDFEPEMGSAPLTFGSVLERLDYEHSRWPGYGLPDDYGYRYAEKEHMKAEEYDAFLFDPSDYVIRSHWPRIFGKLAAFGSLPPIRTLISYSFGLAPGLVPFSTPQATEALDALRRAGEESARVLTATRNFVMRLAEAGFPMFFGSGTQAPFDTLGACFRGTNGILLDMYRRPEKLAAACEKLLPIMVEPAVAAAKLSGNPRVLIPLHKGSDNFMSIEQFQRFYWPTLKELLLALIREELTPVLMVEGPYHSRLQTLRDVPEGKVIYWFQNIDMVKAKAVLKGRACIMGSVPMELLAAGTAAQVKEYCRQLLDSMGGDGFILSSAAVLDDAKPECVRALVDSVRG